MTGRLADLHALIGGEITRTDHGWAITFPDGSEVYAGLKHVRLHRPRRALVDLGHHTAPADVLAAAYRAQVMV